MSKVLKDTSYSDEKNMVYAGGGHTILEFADKDEARHIVGTLTERIYRDFDGLSVFAITVAYEEGQSVRWNMENLARELERKELLRENSFHQGSYGIEKIDANTLDVTCQDKISEEKDWVTRRELGKDEEGKRAFEEFYPAGYQIVSKFEELGGRKNESNFIAVVHIDGNGMGKRIENLYSKVYQRRFMAQYASADEIAWEDMKPCLRCFSEGIDRAYKESFKEMTEEVGKALQGGSLKEKLNLKGNPEKEKVEEEDTKEERFPVRRVITAGDDICFVTEGRIGIECARIFIEKLCEKENPADGGKYSACAGVAIVHTKYPFYRAYELAERLCGHAKKVNAKISAEDNGGSISSIDWHIEFGEIGDSIEDIRRKYVTADGNVLQIRPYIIQAPAHIIAGHLARRYHCFRSGMACLLKNIGVYGKGKIKELCGALKNGENAARNYLKFYRMENLVRDNSYILDEGKALDWLKLFTGTEKDIQPFIELEDGKKHSVLYDMIELMDYYLLVEGEEKG